jgi:hypothetical protein
VITLVALLLPGSGRWEDARAPLPQPAE